MEIRGMALDNHFVFYIIKNDRKIIMDVLLSRRKKETSYV